MAPVEFVNRLDEIVATLEDVSGTGLNLTSDGSTIAVTGPDGVVEGVQTSHQLRGDRYSSPQMVQRTAFIP